jgi:hypothetical protein
MTEDKQVSKAALNCLYPYCFDEGARLELRNLINEIERTAVIE